MDLLYNLLLGPKGWGWQIFLGALVTLGLAGCAGPLAFAGGLMLAVLKLSRHATVRAICEGYTTFFRGVPDLLALFIVYFGFQKILDYITAALGLDRIDINSFLASVIALSVVAVAYSSEIWVGALKAVPKGQREAAEALGLHRINAFFLVILPQLVRIALPGLSNVWMVLLKDTALVSALGLFELMGTSRQAAVQTQKPLFFLGIVACALYLVISLASEFVLSRLERRFNRGFSR
ncbi:ABC transporter permease [Methylovirgula sp. 4M-Z18]|uniref:ABC transporter permease n=1 Tax=Methylovirgula sp. 4M-Z18 TaxID=2293567 RepID=UPI000E2FD7C6|nr:ABC transporter permease subunit [Methylovirgula sp. 4M-Z18]RFB80043.1 ABC transporter permease subunit [Methylovirgula sp. 4M-Z18]